MSYAIAKRVRRNGIKNLRSEGTLQPLCDNIPQKQQWLYNNECDVIECDNNGFVVYINVYFVEALIILRNRRNNFSKNLV